MPTEPETVSVLDAVAAIQSLTEATRRVGKAFAWVEGDFAVSALDRLTKIVELADNPDSPTVRALLDALPNLVQRLQAHAETFEDLARIIDEDMVPPLRVTLERVPQPE